MQELEYPFEANAILKKKRSLKRRLLADGRERIQKRIAVLGGSTTSDICQVLELFLLDQGIEPIFYQSEYNQYFEDVMFDNPELVRFHPDIVYIHTTTRNIHTFPSLQDDEPAVNGLLEETYGHYEAVWNKLLGQYHAVVIQNNFEPVTYRTLGNLDVSDLHGRQHFLDQLNARFYAYARSHQNFLIQDVSYLASCYGIEKWDDPFYWHMYKYSPAVPAIPELAFNLSNMIKALYGRNKKALALDLDQTLWGGIVGDDGPENIEIGQETATGQMYAEFQQYLKSQKDIGVVLTVDSKNEEENALAGLHRPDSVLHPDDFVEIKANWEPKDQNLKAIARDLNIGEDSFVFVDDNPAERHIVAANVPGAAVPNIGRPEEYIRILNRSGFFEPVAVSKEDAGRTAMYQKNAARHREESTFSDYGSYLQSLAMKAEIRSFIPMYMSRIAQLTNKSNQFNLTTLRCSQADIERIAAEPDAITLYGKLTDRFGDNGVVSVVFGHIRKTRFDIEEWLMSCRVLKRGMEEAMMDTLVEKCRDCGVDLIHGKYIPTKKNKMVADFYEHMGFSLMASHEDGTTEWICEVGKYQPRNRYISVNPPDAKT